MKRKLREYDELRIEAYKEKQKKTKEINKKI